MSSSTTGNVTEERHNFISIMAIERDKRSAPSAIIKTPYGQRSTTGSLYNRRDDHQNFVSCRELHLCGGPGGDSEYRLKSEKREYAEPASKTKGSQTDYRESETQTSPWEAPYRLMPQANESPEVLRLAKSTWGNGLPAGIHEVQIIRRMRMKRAWLEAMPPMDTPENIKTREAITAAIEANEWAFREEEIQCIMDARMELLERIARNKNKEKEEKSRKRIEKYSKSLSQLRDKEIRNIRGKFARDLRKLTVKHRTSMKRRTDFIAKCGISGAKLDLYATDNRFGGNIDESHKLFSKTLLRESCVDGETTQTDDATKLLSADQSMFGTNRDSRPQELCPRQTRWNDEKLRNLYADLKAIRLNSSNKEESYVPSLLKRKLKAPTLPVTPAARGDDNTDNYWDNCSLFVQKITRGRAVQCMMYEGRNRCRELIEELQSTRALQESKAVSRRNDKCPRNFEDNDEELRDNRICEILDSLEGKTVADMLDMLSKEDTRLREERRAHGFALLAERERNKREAEESGRRQLERNRRRELDEMFRQIVKVNQDSVEAYLEDVIKEGIEWVSEDQARQYVVELADKIDASISETAEHNDPPKGEDLIADMVHNFLLPEVDKEMIRKKMRSKQQSYMRDAHIAISEETMKSMENAEISAVRKEAENEKAQEADDSSTSEIHSND